MTNRSRISRRLEKKTKQSLIISFLGIVIVLFLLFKIGIPLFANFTIFVSGLKGNQDSNTQSKQVEFIPPPILNPSYNATNSAEISLSGIAQENQTIKLYLNDEINDETKTKKDGSFLFENIKLIKGNNNFKVKAITSDKKESDFSGLLSIIYKETAPKLEIESPSDNQSYGKDDNPAKISGKTDPDTNITVNGYTAIVDEKGNFTYQLTLANGENTIVIEATDQAGNKIRIERKVNYSQ